MKKIDSPKKTTKINVLLSEIDILSENLGPAIELVLHQRPKPRVLKDLAARAIGYSSYAEVKRLNIEYPKHLKYKSPLIISADTYPDDLYNLWDMGGKPCFKVVSSEDIPGYGDVLYSDSDETVSLLPRINYYVGINEENKPVIMPENYIEWSNSLNKENDFEEYTKRQSTTIFHEGSFQSCIDYLSVKFSVNTPKRLMELIKDSESYDEDFNSLHFTLIESKHKYFKADSRNQLQPQIIIDSMKQVTLSHLVTRQEWKTIKDDKVKSTNSTCEICGANGVKHDMYVDELWEQDYANKIQKLEDIVCLCERCYQVRHHEDFWSTGGFSIYEQNKSHLSYVNNWTHEESEAQLGEALDKYYGDSKIEWYVEINWGKIMAGLKNKYSSRISTKRNKNC